MINIITESEKLSQLANALVDRAYEYNTYQTNINNYSIILESLGNLEWTPELEPLRALPPHEAAYQVSLDQVELLSKLQQIDRLNMLIRTEILECNKVRATYDALESQLPEDQKDQLIADAIAKRTNV